MPSQLPWFNSDKSLLPAVHDLRTLVEIPSWVYDYSPRGPETWGNEHDYKGVDGTVNLAMLRQERELMNSEIGFINKRLENFDRINLFHLWESTGRDALPFILEFLEDERMGIYTSVLSTSLQNRYAINRLKSFVIEARIPPFLTESVVVNLQFNTFEWGVKEIKEKSKQMIQTHKETKGEKLSLANVYLLLNSSLGNSLNPKQLLKNIYESMDSGDYLVVIQGIYQSGSENSLVSDYTNWINQDNLFLIHKDITSYFTEDPRIHVEWDKRGEFNGVKGYIDAERPSTLFGIDVAEKQRLTVFRSARPTLEELEHMFHIDIGFHSIGINFDSTHDNALFILRK